MSVTSEDSSLDSIGFNFDNADFDLDVLDDFDLMGDVIGKGLQTYTIQNHCSY